MFRRAIKFFGQLWVCSHDYQIINKVNLYQEGKRLPVGKEYHLACTKCARVQRKRI